jgi:ethanolamine utilization protein EutN
MQIATIVGHATATVKHPSLIGWALLLVQPLTVEDKPDGEPLLAIDKLGAGAGDRVILSSDSLAACEMVGSRKSPVRWWVMGLCDPQSVRSPKAHADR